MRERRLAAARTKGIAIPADILAQTGVNQGASHWVKDLTACVGMVGHFTDEEKHQLVDELVDLQ